MDYSQLITIEPAKRRGQPCIRGIRHRGCRPSSRCVAAASRPSHWV